MKFCKGWEIFRYIQIFSVDYNFDPMKKILFGLLMFAGSSVCGQQLVDFKLFQKQRDVDVYLKSISTIVADKDSIKRIIENNELTELLPLPLIRSNVCASLITVHFFYAEAIRSYISDVVAITIDSKYASRYLALWDSKYSHIKDHWEYNSGKSIAGKKIYYQFEFELGPNDHIPLCYSLVRGKWS